MRRWLAVALVAACGGSPKPAPSPSLEPDPPAVMPPLPASFETEFAIPKSTPSGDPIKVAAFVPAPGLHRTRTIDKLFTVDEDLDEGEVFRQRTTTRFMLREEILAAVDTTIQKLQVTADTAEERVELRGTPHQQQLLDGTYVVAPGVRALTVTRQAGTHVGSREVEELSDLYADEIGVPYAVSAVLATKSLRFGEAIDLSDDDLRMLHAETDITLSLVALDGDIATFQFLSTISGPYALGDKDDIENVGTKATVAVERSTGRVIRTDLLDLRVVGQKSQKRSQRTMKLDYVR